MLGIRDFLLRCMRVWKITRKPEVREFKDISKVSAIGTLIIGFIGFLIAIIIKLIMIK
ncbi:protein translocase SEC61 complex subunit gamma [Candidatus Pacearchaeota archaeon]|nr:protein translocase SEC61 complex subunit gamma [Candidatus Pacearchaeota archaeon]